MFEKDITRTLAKKLGKTYKEVEGFLEQPQDSSFGDISFPCFVVAKEQKRSPSELAAQLKKSIALPKGIENIESSGPYLNFFIDYSSLAETIFQETRRKKSKFGHTNKGKGEVVVIEFSSPNIGKPFGIAHLRSTVIGNSLSNIYASQGYKVERVNYLGDWGTQFGNLMCAFQMWGDEKELKKNSIRHLLSLYIKFHAEAEKDEALKKKGKEWFVRLEGGDKKAKGMWKKFCGLNLKEFKRIYHLLNIKIDHTIGEAFYEPMLKKTIEFYRNKGLLKESDGALILEYPDLPPAIVQKKDGTTIYLTRDLAAAKHRRDIFKFKKMLYVADARQTLHFQQLFKALEIAGFKWARQCEHVPFGVMKFKGEPLATRKGNFIFLEDVLLKAVSKVESIIDEKNPSLGHKEEVARQVAFGAVIYWDLNSDRVRDVVFDLDQVLNFEGDTAPYIQYTSARLSSILAKASPPRRVDSFLLNSQEEKKIIGSLAKFESVIWDAKMHNKPHLLTNYLSALAQECNNFYNKHPVLVNEKDLRAARLHLIFAARQVLINGLSLLGIHSPFQM